MDSPLGFKLLSSMVLMSIHQYKWIKSGRWMREIPIVFIVVMLNL